MTSANFKFAMALAAVMATSSACRDNADPAQEITAVVQAEKTPSGKTSYAKKDTYFKLPSAAGGEIDLAAYAGRPVLFMLFTETCPYCRKAAPTMQKLHKTYGPKGLAVLGICIEDNPEAAKNFAADLGTTFPLAYDAREVYQKYRAQGVPYIYLLSAEHQVAAVWPGYDRSFDQEMARKIEAELARK